MIPVDAMNFVDGEGQTASLPFGDYQAVAECAPPFIAEAVINAQQPSQADTNQQLAAHVDQAEYHPLPPVGQGMNHAAFDHLLESPGAQCQPLRSYAKND